MPELPEVETVVRQIRPELVGRRLLGAAVRWRRSVSRPGAAAFCSGLAGREVEAVERRGKYFVFRLTGGRHVVGHLRMTGRLFVGRGSDPPYTRVRIELDDGRALFFTDVRKFGRLALVGDPNELLGDLGPEPLGPELSPRWMAAALGARRRALKPLLLDQTFLAGLGNIYVDESLHRARLHPLRLSHTVGGDEAAALVRAIRAVLRRAVAAEGSSFDVFYRTPQGQPGSFQEQFSVYGREGRPCRACGCAIVRLVVGQRGTWLCPTCQPRRRGRRKGPHGVARNVTDRDAGARHGLRRKAPGRARVELT